VPPYDGYKARVIAEGHRGISRIPLLSAEPG